VTIETRDVGLDGPDGTVPVRVFAPSEPRGGLIVYMDAFGMRPELDGMCRDWASQGYTTFLPDLYWRQGRLRFPTPGGAHEPLHPAMVKANLATTMDMTVADTRTILDRFGGTGPGLLSRFGAIGYCMGARHALAAAAAWPDAIRFAACLHGGRMVWDGPDSPHLLIPKVKGSLYLAFATDDETCPDNHQALLRETLAASGVRGEAERVAAGHGWMFPDRWCWDEAVAGAVKTKILGVLASEVAA
jgi:carboxymethylenebutenolidase